MFYNPQVMNIAHLPNAETVGLLLSGGIDSTVLLWHLLDGGNRVQPIYVCAGHRWQAAELNAIDAILRQGPSRQIAPLKLFQVPLKDLYGAHWSLDNDQPTPAADSPDDAVYLPGRNLLLVTQPALWCQLTGIRYLALAPLGSSPFADATPAFFQKLERILRLSAGQPLQILVPFAGWDKKQVIAASRGAPLHLSFSCLQPQSGHHCGRCNKCAERGRAMAAASMSDPTPYHDAARPALRAV